MRISLVVAMAIDGTIGDKGTMPWHLPSDLARFNKITQCGTVIMGRKTWDSLPEKFRPLPYRQNIVLTHTDANSVRQAGGLAVESVHHALVFSDHPGRTFVIGGAQIYKLFAPRAQRAYVTRVYGTFGGDTRLYKKELFEPEAWEPSREPELPNLDRGRHDPRDSHDSDFQIFVRR